MQDFGRGPRTPESRTRNETTKTQTCQASEANTLTPPPDIQPPRYNPGAH